ATAVATGVRQRNRDAGGGKQTLRPEVNGGHRGQSLVREYVARLGCTGDGNRAAGSDNRPKDGCRLLLGIGVAINDLAIDADTAGGGCLWVCQNDCPFFHDKVSLKQKDTGCDDRIRRTQGIEIQANWSPQSNR